jgi:hypothetical protein
LGAKAFENRKAVSFGNIKFPIPGQITFGGGKYEKLVPYG